MADWYVRHESGEPIGPVAAELLVRGIAAGKVPADAEVCEVGTDEWLPLEAIEEFQDALPDDGVQTRVIESPWFMDQTNPSTPGATLPAAYTEDDEAATRVAPTPFGDSQPGVPLPSAPRAPAGKARPAERSKPLPPPPAAKPAASRPLAPPPSRRGVAPPPAASSSRKAAPPKPAPLRKSAPRAAPPAPKSAPRAAPPAPKSAPHAAPPAPPAATSAPRAAPAKPAAASARYDEVDDEAATRVAQAPTDKSAARFPSPRPAAGAPALPPAPPALTPLPGAGQLARGNEEPTAPGARSTLPRQATPGPPAPAPLPPQRTERSLLPLVVLILVLALALVGVLFLLARR